jgi:hypothetical protein
VPPPGVHKRTRRVDPHAAGLSAPLLPTRPRPRRTALALRRGAPPSTLLPLMMQQGAGRSLKTGRLRPAPYRPRRGSTVTVFGRPGLRTNKYKVFGGVGTILRPRPPQLARVPDSRLGAGSSSSTFPEWSGPAAGNGSTAVGPTCGRSRTRASCARPRTGTAAPWTWHLRCGTCSDDRVESGGRLAQEAAGPRSGRYGRSKGGELSRWILMC